MCIRDSAEAVFDGVLTPDLVPAGSPLVSTSEASAAPPAPTAATDFDCSKDCADQCQRPDRCLRDEAQLKVAGVGMGNPHVVVPVDDLASIHFDAWGAALEVHPAFPAKTNVHFLQVHSRERLEIRVLSLIHISEPTRPY